jgi:hypothetical protein
MVDADVKGFSPEPSTSRASDAPACGDPNVRPASSNPLSSTSVTVAHFVRRPNRTWLP